MFRFFCVFCFMTFAWEGGAETVYENDFEETEIGEVPDDFLVLDGEFEVKQEEGNKVLELPGTPLSTYGLLFGPNEQEGFAVSARIKGEKTKRRYPSLGVGIGGVSGYKLRINPAIRAVEILKLDDQAVAEGPFTWKSGTWTHFHLQVRKPSHGKWVVEGKVWEDGELEADAPMVTFEDEEKPITGRFSIWGIPYSDNPIQFDDLKVTKIPTE